jgi:hypothetical protein
MAGDFDAVLDGGDEGAAFWIGGLAAAVGAAVFLLFPGRGEPFENAEYIALGAAVPALAAALALGNLPAEASRRIRAGLTGLFAAFVAYYLIAVLRRFEWEAWAAAGFVAVGVKRSGARSKTAAAAFVAAGLGFTCAFRLFWWDVTWRAFVAKEPLVWILLPGFTALGLEAFLAGENGPHRLKAGIWDAPALLIFALSSTRIAIDETAFYTGTVALLRRGASLLWDTPSQYGFLDMALTSLVPASSPWAAVYRVNCALLFVSALAVYAALRLATRGRWGIVYSALLAWAAVLLVPGKIAILDGPNTLPSVGAFRFLWCYALLAWAAALFMRRRAGRRVGPRDLAPGVLFWTLGCLWSAESAAYSCAAAWPVFAFAAYESARARRFKEAAAIGAAPAAALAASVAAIGVFYRVRLGHGPDWRCFVEYALAYQGGFGAMPIWPRGAVAALVWAGILIVALAAVSLRKSPAAKWAIVPAFGVYWMTSSYFVSRSHDNNVLNLAPIWLSALVLSFVAAGETRPAVRVLRAGALPLMAGLLLAAFSDPANLRRHAESMLASRSAGELERSIPAPDGEVESLLRRAGVSEDDGLAVFWPNLFARSDAARRPELPRPWLPLAPAPELGLLDVKRQNLYVRRFLDREGPAAAEGWTLEPKAFDRPDLKSEPVVASGLDRLPNPRASGLYGELLRDHRVDRTLESAHWRLTHFRLGLSALPEGGVPRHP